MTDALLDVLTAEPSYGPALRRLICELAISGRLLPQTSTWTECRLEEIVSVRGGSTPSMARPEYWGGDVPWVSPKDMHVGDIVTSEMFVTQEALAKTNLELVPLGSVLIVGRSGILKRKLPAQVTRVACTVNQDIKALTPKSAIESAYLRLWLLGSERAILAEDVKTGTTVQSLVFAKLFARRVQLPSKAEQHRIVAKVGELMALCDRLEAEQADAEAAHAQLVQALLASLTQARDAADFRASWQQLAEHFHTLFTTEASVDALERSAIQIALMGRMNTASQADAPASEFVVAAKEERRLRAAQTDRKRLGANGAEPLPTAFAGPVPERWAACRVDEVTECLDYLRKPINKAEREGRQGNVPYYGANGPVGWIDEHLFDEDLVLVVEDETFIGRTKPFSYVITGKSWVNNHAHVLRPLGGMSATYLNLCLHRYDFVPLTSGTTGRRKLTQAGLNGAVFLVAPLAEQHRIVKRVDELAALCIQLRLRIAQARKHHEHLASVLVEDAVV